MEKRPTCAQMCWGSTQCQWLRITFGADPPGESPILSLSTTVSLNSTQRGLDSFSQTHSHVVGADTPGRISPKLTEAIAGQVMDEINSVLSVSSLDAGLFSIPAAGSRMVSKDRASDKTLDGAVSTMKLFLSGQCSAAKGRMQTDKGLDEDSKEETQTGRWKGKRRRGTGGSRFIQLPLQIQMRRSAQPALTWNPTVPEGPNKALIVQRRHPPLCAPLSISVTTRLMLKTQKCIFSEVWIHSWKWRSTTIKRARLRPFEDTLSDFQTGGRDDCSCRSISKKWICVWI